MRRPGVDPTTALPNDVVCDFCLRDWDLAQPMIEGPDDALICYSCLHMAFGHIFRLKLDDAPPDWVCVMCNEHRPGIAFPSMYTESVICGRCARRGVRKMNANPPVGWHAP